MGCNPNFPFISLIPLSLFLSCSLLSLPVPFFFDSKVGGGWGGGAVAGHRRWRRRHCKPLPFVFFLLLSSHSFLLSLFPNPKFSENEQITLDLKTRKSEERKNFYLSSFSRICNVGMSFVVDLSGFECCSRLESSRVCVYGYCLLCCVCDVTIWLR